MDDGNELIVGDNEQDGPDSPWTIEAVNSESEEKDEVRFYSSRQMTGYLIFDVFAAHRRAVRPTHTPPQAFDD